MQHYLKPMEGCIEFDTVEDLEGGRVFHTHHTWYKEPTGNGQWFGGAAEVDRPDRLFSSLLGWEESKEAYDMWMSFAHKNTTEP